MSGLDVASTFFCLGNSNKALTNNVKMTQQTNQTVVADDWL